MWPLIFLLLYVVSRCNKKNLVKCLWMGKIKYSLMISLITIFCEAPCTLKHLVLFNIYCIFIYLSWFISILSISTYCYVSLYLVYLSLSIYLFLSISMYLYLSLFISIYLYLSLSISIFLCLFLSISCVFPTFW